MSRQRSTFLVVGWSSGTAETQEQSALHASLQALAAERDGRVVETTARDLVAAFRTPTSALDCALAMQAEPGEEGQASARAGGERRFGINIASLETEAAYDAAIAEARRLRETAEPGGVQISPELHEACHVRLERERCAATADISVRCPAATKLTVNSRRFRTQTAAQRHAIRIGAAVAMACALGVPLTLQSGLTSRTAVPWAPLTVSVHQAQIGGLAPRHPLTGEQRAHILLRMGVTNRTEEEIDLRRGDFRLEIGGQKVEALPPLGRKTRYDDSALFASVGTNEANQERWSERQPLYPGGSAIVRLHFYFPLESLDTQHGSPSSPGGPHPLSRWTTGMIVERLGSDAPRLHYGGRAGRVCFELASDPLGSPAAASQSTSTQREIAVFPVRQPVHTFNAHRVWRFVEQQLAREKRPVLVDMHRWPSPDLAVRAFLESRVERAGHPAVAFVADGVTNGMDAAHRQTHHVWFADTSAASLSLRRRNRSR